MKIAPQLGLGVGLGLVLGIGGNFPRGNCRGTLYLIAKVESKKRLKLSCVGKKREAKCFTLR